MRALVEQHALDPSLPGLDEVLDAVDAGTFAVTTNNAYEVEISRAIQRVYVGSLDTPGRDGRHAAGARGRARCAWRQRARAIEGDAHAQLLADDIKRFLERPLPAQLMETPAGAPRRAYRRARAGLAAARRAAVCSRIRSS